MRTSVQKILAENGIDPNYIHINFNDHLNSNFTLFAIVGRPFIIIIIKTLISEMKLMKNYKLF